MVSLEDLVPAPHFYRHLDRVLDLTFVRDLVKETYAHGGRPSIDPVVFFKLQLVMFFEDIRAARLLMQLVADKLGARWYVGYNLDEPLPDHSSLTRIRERYASRSSGAFLKRLSSAVKMQVFTLSSLCSCIGSNPDLQRYINSQCSPRKILQETSLSLTAPFRSR